MARRMATYTIGVDADTSKFEASLRTALTSLQQLGAKSQIVPTLLKASTAALDLAKNLETATNVETGKLDLSIFNKNLVNSGLSLKSYYNLISQLGPAGLEAFLKVALSITAAELPLRRSNTLINNLWTTMKNTMRWQFTSSALNSFVGSLESAYGYAKDLDRSLNEIRIVSGQSAEDMARFAEQANKAAKALSTTTTDYTDASLIYYQQGLSDQEVLDRTETTIKMANVAGTTAETASQQLTAIWNNFYDGSESLEHYADVMVKLGAATASSSDEISEGIEKFAAVADTVGLSYEYAASALATVTAQTRESASVVGTAFRTLFSRIQGLEQGETLDDGTTLNKYSNALATVGVEIKDTNGELKGMDEILDDLGGKWNTLAQDQKIALAETVAGVRQWTQLIALMDNWDFFKENLALAENADGSLQQQADVYAESWEAARDRTKAAAEDIYDSLINPDFYISIDNAITPVLSGIADVIDAMGGLKGVLAASVLIINQVFGKLISESLRETAVQIGFLTNLELLRARALLQQAATLAKTISIELMGVEGPQREALNITQQQIELQGLVNSKVDQLNERQKSILEQDLNHLKSLLAQSAEYATQATKADELAQKLKSDITDKVTVNNNKGDIKNYLNKEKKSASDDETKRSISAVQLLIRHSNTAEKAVAKITTRLEEVSKLEAKLQVISTRIKSLGNESDTLTKELREVAYEMGGLDKNATDELISAYFKLVEQDLEKLNSESSVLRNTLENFLPEKDITLVLRFTAALKQGASATEALNYAVQEYEKNNARVTEGLKQNQYATKDWADKIVEVGSALSQVAMSVQAIQSIKNVFEDADMSAGERLITIFTSLGMLLPATISLMKGLNGATQLVTISETKEVTVKSLGITSSLAKAAADKILAGATGEVATVTAIANAEIVASVIAIAPYIALVAALGVAIYGVVKAYNADADAAKEASAGVEVLTDNYNDAKQAAAELKNTINNWDEAVASIGDLTKGTEEYTQAVEDANAKAKELIETYQLFDRTKWDYDENGLIRFKNDVLDNLQEEADKRESAAESSLYSGKIYENNANIRSQLTNTERELGSIVNDNGYYRQLNDKELQTALDTINTKEPISDEELLKNLTDLIPGLQLTIDGLDDFKDKLKELSESMDDAAEANSYYAKEILKSDIKENRKSQIDDIAGDNEDLENAIIDAYAARKSQVLEEQDKSLEDVSVDRSQYSSNAKLSDLLGIDIEGDEQLARLYAEKILGRTDVDQLDYQGHIGKGQLKDSSGEDIFASGTLSDEYMRRMLALLKATDDLKNSLSENSGFDESAYEETMKKLVDKSTEFSKSFDGADLTTGILNSLAKGVDSIDISSILDELSPEAIEKLGGMSGDDWKNALGLTDEDFQNIGFLDANAWAESFKSSLENWNALDYWNNQADKSNTNALSIGRILSSYQNDEELSEDQVKVLDTLGEKYEDLNTLRNEGGHEYLQLLREIQEQEEANRLTALEHVKEELQAKADSLQQEIEQLKQQQEQQPEMSDTYQVQIDAKTDEFEKTMDDIMDTDYQIDVAVNADLASDIDQAFGLADEIEKLQGYLSDGLEISFDRAQEIIAAGYGQMLTNAQETADSTIKLNRDVVNNFIDGKQSEINADRESKIAQLENERALLVAKQQTLLAALNALNNGLAATSNTAKAEALIQASKYKAQADAAQVTAEQSADAADQSNDEISKDAEKLVTALGLLHETDAENAQQAYSDAATAAAQSASAQINALNQIQLAAVAYSNAVRAAATGSATYNPVSSGVSSGNVKVGATGSKAGSSTYATSKANITLSTDDILKAANNSTEVLNEALNLSVSEIQSEMQAAKDGVGALDGAIASLKSANLSLDKAQAGLGSGSGKGKGGSGGSGDKGKTYDKEDLKTLKDVEDRYHNINRQLERQDDLLDDLGNKTDRAWGAEALAGYEDEIKALEKQLELYNEKLKEAQKYLTDDSALVKKYFSDALIASNGEITNYEALLKKNMDLYNAAVKQYNLAVDGKTLTEEQHTALKNKLDAEKKLFDERADALKQYEDTLDEVRDTTDNIEENMRSIADKKLEEIKFRLEVVLDVKSMKETARDLSKEISEIFGDTLTQNFMGYDKFESPLALDAEAAKAEANLMPRYKQQYEELKALYDSTTDDADRLAIMDEISDLQGKIADSAKSIVEWANSIEDIVPDAVDAAAERFAAFTDQLDHNTSVLDTIKELYNLQGVTYKTASGFNRLQKVSQEKLEAQVASAKLLRGWYEEAAKRLETAQANLDALNGDESDLRYDALKKARDAYLEQFNDAQEAYLSSAQEAMETAQDMYLDQIERAVYKFGQAVSNGVGLDLLQDKYDHYIEQNERYFDKVNEAYLVSAWYNKLQQDIDDTTNSAHKERLKALQEEINQRREGNKLSQYDLDILNAKYQVLQAQMALEDAQNAKNQIQLTRDSQGNWNYQYTANQDDIANAQQKLLDAENEWYNIAKQQVTDVTGEIVDTWQECQDKIKDIYSDMTLTDEERSAQAQEIYQYYTEKIKFLEEEKQNAIADMTEAGNKNLIDNAILTGDTITDVTGITSEELQQIVANSGESIKDLLLKNSEQLKDIVGDNTDLIDKFDNTYAKDLDNMTQNTTNFEDELRRLLEEAQQHFQDYQDKVQNVASETGTTLSDLTTETDKVSEATDQLTQRGLEAKDALWEQVTAAQQAADQYAALAEQIWEAVEAAKTLAAQMASDAASSSGLLYDKNTDYAALIEQGLVNGWFQYGDETFNALVAQRDEKIKNEDKWKDETPGGDQFESYKPGSNVGQWAQGRYDTEEKWNEALDKLKNNYGLATGGYTGTFEDAKLAFLHEKELVLNKEDTENILAAVQAVRTIGSDLFKSIEKSLDGNVVAAMNLMGQRLNPVSTMPMEGTIEQTVHIDKVEFPNVTSRSEIEEAFVSLTNDAAQWARRKT